MLKSTLKPNVIAAGDRISEDMLNASICKAFGIMGGGLELSECLVGITEDRDIVEAYVGGHLTCVEGIYLAMKREEAKP